MNEIEDIRAGKATSVDCMKAVARYLGVFVVLHPDNGYKPLPLIPWDSFFKPTHQAINKFLHVRYFSWYTVWA